MCVLIILTLLIYFTRHNKYDPKTDNKGIEGITLKYFLLIFFLRFSNKIRSVDHLVIRITDRIIQKLFQILKLQQHNIIDNELSKFDKFSKHSLFFT